MQIHTQPYSRGVFHSINIIPIAPALICVIAVFLSACNYSYPLSGEIQNIDQSFEGEWHLDTGETILVQTQPDGYLILDLGTSEAKEGVLFDQGVILKIGGHYFLQAHLVGTVQPGRSLQKKVTENPWMVREIARQGNRIWLQDVPPQPYKFNNVADFRSWFVATIRSGVPNESRTVVDKVGALGSRNLAAVRKSDKSGMIIAGIAAIAAIWAISSAESPTQSKPSANAAPKWDPGEMCCDSRSYAPPARSIYWVGHDLWCWTDYNEVLEGNKYKHPTYCQNSNGSYWQRNGLFDKCEGVEGWCD